MDLEEFKESYLKNSTNLILDNKIYLDGVQDYKYLCLEVAEIQYIDNILGEAIINNVSFKDKLMVVEITQNGYLSKQQCDNLIKNRDILRSMGSDLKVLDGDLWDLEDIFHANAKMDNAVNKIKSTTVEENGAIRPLNEMEKFLMAYMFVTNRKYHENDQNHSSSRTITSILKTDDIVCVGFAHLLKEMCNRLDIECYINCCQVKDVRGVGGHENNVVVIGGIPYYCDACWDCIKADEEERHFNYCLLPCDDTHNFSSCAILRPSAPYTNMDADKEMAMNALDKINNSGNVQDYFKLVNNNWFKKYIDIVYKGVSQKPDFSNPFNRQPKDEVIRYLENIITVIDSKHNDNFYALSEFENALLNVYKANGHNDEIATEKVDMIIKSTIEKAGTIFKPDALNCFSQEYHKSLEL